MSGVPRIPAQVQCLTKDIRAEWELQGESSSTEQADSCTGSAKEYFARLTGLHVLRLVQPVSMDASDAAAEVGTVLTLGWHSYSRTPINSIPAHEFRTQYGFCKTAKRALARVIQSYRTQMLSG